jgi:hypothetical protein
MYNLIYIVNMHFVKKKRCLFICQNKRGQAVCRGAYDEQYLKCNYVVFGFCTIQLIIQYLGSIGNSSLQIICTLSKLLIRSHMDSLVH